MALSVPMNFTSSTIPWKPDSLTNVILILLSFSLYIHRNTREWKVYILNGLEESAPHGLISTVLIQRKETPSQGEKGDDFIQVLLFPWHSDECQKSLDNLLSGVKGSFIPYLKVFLHSSGLDAVFSDCNSFLCWTTKDLVCMLNHWVFSCSMLKEPGIYHLFLIFHSSLFNFLILLRGSPVLKTTRGSLV